MTDILSAIRTVLPDAPAELATLYDDESLPAYPQSRIQFLGFEAALDYTRGLADWLIPNQLGLWALDDAGDSNPFCYISKGPCKGAILHFHHDDDSTVTFPDLRSLLSAMHAAGRAQIDIDDVTKPAAPTFDCSSAIRSLLQSDADENESVVCLYVRCCGTLSDELVGELVRHSSFFIRESMGQWLSKHPAAQYLSHAEALATDKQPQVAAQGVLARKAINRLIHGSR